MTIVPPPIPTAAQSPPPSSPSPSPSPSPSSPFPSISSSTSSSILPLDDLFNNPVFAGGIGLAGLGAFAAVARRSLVQAAHLVRRRLLVSLEISKQDESYPWVLAWLSQPRPQTSFLAARLTRIHNLSMRTVRSSSSSSSDVNGSGSGGNNNGDHTAFFLQPGYGRHVLHHAGAYISVSRERQSTANHATGEPFETLTLTTLYAQRHVFESVFAAAHALSRAASAGKTPLWASRGVAWERFGEPRRKRPLASVVLDAGVAERVVADVRDFLRRQRWYTERGIPYRRGYLLHGPPGGGKSSFVLALAGELDVGVAMVNLSERGLTDDRLALLLTRLPPRTLLLLEDADAAFVNRRQADADGYAGASVTFSGLLNALDGVAAGEQRIAFLTTNHVERLDEALVRPGRVDLMCRIGGATRWQAARMWERFYGDVDGGARGRERFLARLEALRLVGREVGGREDEAGVGRRTSPAAIQGLFLFNKDDMDGAIAMAEGLVPQRHGDGGAAGSSRTEEKQGGGG